MEKDIEGIRTIDGCIVVSIVWYDVDDGDAIEAECKIYRFKRKAGDENPISE